MDINHSTASIFCSARSSASGTPFAAFLVQTDADVFNEVVCASSLPCFTTDYGQLQGGYPNRVNIPLTDAEADVIFYLASRNTDK